MRRFPCLLLSLLGLLTASACEDRNVPGAQSIRFQARVPATRTVFTAQEDIPVGSVLVLKSGYQYRPEGWTRLSARTTNRPGNVTTQVVPVTESWWNGWAYRAFNLAEAGNPALTPARMDALLSCLSIFVPVSD